MRSRVRALSPALACALALPAAAEARTGGSGYRGAPAISQVECTSGCATSSARSAGSRVAVQRGGTVRIKGRNLGAVRAVVFLGRAGTRDDSGARPTFANARKLAVRVPPNAASGPVRLIDRFNRRSKPSRRGLRVVKPPPPPEAVASPYAIWPVDGTVTSPFGPRWGRNHDGIDIGAPTGTPIKAVADGTVIYVGWAGGYGNYTCIADAARTTCYAHQSAMLVSKGDTVTVGQVIGKVGSTGNSTGPHLHFEVRLGQEMWAKPVDPMPYLPARSKASASSRSGPPMDFDLPVFGEERE